MTVQCKQPRQYPRDTEEGHLVQPGESESLKEGNI